MQIILAVKPMFLVDGQLLLLALSRCYTIQFFIHIQLFFRMPNMKKQTVYVNIWIFFAPTMVKKFLLYKKSAHGFDLLSKRYVRSFLCHPDSACVIWCCAVADPWTGLFSRWLKKMMRFPPKPSAWRACCLVTSVTFCARHFWGCEISFRNG